MTDHEPTLALVSGGLRVAVHDETRGRGLDFLDAAGLDPDRVGASCPARGDAATVSLVLEGSRRHAEPGALRPVTRGVWSTPDGAVLLDSAGGSGFAQRWTVTPQGLEVRSRWAPSPAEAAASRLRGRFRALRAQVLLHYPVMWWAGVLGLAPLHVSVLDLDGVVVLLAGPGGVGKSTLVARELAAGCRATCDNLAVSDGRAAFGLREPLRLPTEVGAAGGGGTRTTHGRREHRWSGHVPALTPDLVVVVRRGDGDRPRVRPVGPDEAARALVAGTLAAGELRRYWAIQAALGLATGLGPVLPTVVPVAERLTSALPCLEVELGRTPGAPLSVLLAAELGQIRRQGVTK